MPAYSKEMEHDSRKYQIELTNFPVLRCTHCGEVMLDDDASRMLSDALRTAAGLLLPSEIRERREGLGLTQRDLAGKLLVAESTLSRWETGAQIQQRSMDLLLRGYFQVPEFRSFVGSAGSGHYGPVKATFTAEPPSFAWLTTPVTGARRTPALPNISASGANQVSGLALFDPGMAA